MLHFIPLKIKKCDIFCHNFAVCNAQSYIWIWILFLFPAPGF